MKIKKRDINLYDTLFSGQCFRMFLEEDSSFTIVIKDRVINIKEEGDFLVIDSDKLENLENVVIEYLDLNRDYDFINKELSKRSNLIKNNLNLINGYKILKQDPFEMYISYIISQNNKVSKIQSSIDIICKKFGKKVIFRNKEYYLFPTFEELKDITYDDLKEAKVGFRDKYIINALNAIKYDKNFLENIKNMPSDEAINRLCSVKGIGLKVASCILLFGYSRMDVYPIDTWVKKYVVDNYGVKDNINVIRKLMKEEFGNSSALAIQYFFHINRNKTN